MRSFIKQHRLATGLVATSLLAGLLWLTFGYFAVHTLWVDEEVAEALPTFDRPALALADDDATTANTMVDDMTESTMVGEMADDAASEAAPVTPTPVTSPTQTTTSTPTTPSTPTTTTTPASTVSAPPQIVTAFTGNFVTDSHQTRGVVSVLANGTSQRFIRFEEFATDNGPDVNVYLVNSSAGGVSDFIDLGDMKGNVGDQNYEIPADADLAVYDTVYLWCVRFSVSFAHADLVPA